MTTAISTVLWDLDGTLLDTAPGITATIQHTLETLGRPVPPAEELRSCIGPPFASWFPRLLGSRDPALLEDAVRLYRERYGAGAMFDAVLFEGIAPVVAGFQSRGLRQIVVTSKARPYAEVLVERFGLAPAMPRVYGPELHEHAHDKYDLVRRVLLDERSPLHQVVMIGDRSTDMLAAKRNGLAAIGVRWGYGTDTELALAEALADHPADLVPMLA